MFQWNLPAPLRIKAPRHSSVDSAPTAAEGSTVYAAVDMGFPLPTRSWPPHDATDVSHVHGSVQGLVLELAVSVRREVMGTTSAVTACKCAHGGHVTRYGTPGGGEHLATAVYNTARRHHQSRGKRQKINLPPQGFEPWTFCLRSRCSAN